MMPIGLMPDFDIEVVITQVISKSLDRDYNLIQTKRACYKALKGVDYDVDYINLNIESKYTFFKETRRFYGTQS